MIYTRYSTYGSVGIWGQNLAGGLEDLKQARETEANGFVKKDWRFSFWVCQRSGPKYGGGDEDDNGEEHRVGEGDGDGEGDGEPADDQLHVSLRQARVPSEARDH